MSRRVSLEYAAKIGGVSKATIRSWVHQKRITRYPDNTYDTYEILLWVDQRSLAALCARAGMADPVEMARKIESVAGVKKSA